jgi:Retrotransposon gag protein
MASSSTTGTGTATSTKTIGSPPEPFDGSSTKAEAFWTSLASYFFLNQEIYNTTNKKIVSALSYFKIETSAGEWAKDRQITALAISPPDFGTWKTFRDDFKSHFIPVDATLLSTQQMHSMKMGNHPFSDWYQEWSTHATHSGSNDATKMYAFRQNLLNALHTKILGVHPPSMTLAHLVELAKGFDELYRLYNKSDSSKPQRRPNVRTTTPKDLDAPNIALADFPPKD